MNKTARALLQVTLHSFGAVVCTAAGWDFDKFESCLMTLDHEAYDLASSWFTGKVEV